jgi:hypothetical protein
MMLRSSSGMREQDLSLPAPMISVSLSPAHVRIALRRNSKHDCVTGEVE